MSKLRYFPLLFLGLLIGCQQNSDRTPTNSSISVATATQNNITIKPLSPQPIRINLEDLPPPFHSESASKPPQVIPIPNNPVLNVPPGFKVNIFAENLDNPRWLALTPDGDVLVTETKQNRIRLLKDTNKDGVADQITTFADSKNGLNIPFGMAFSPGYFFLGNTDEVRRYSYNNQQQLTGTGEKIAELPGGGYNQHWTRNVIVSPNNQKLYVSIGSKTNVSEENPPRASVQVMNLDGSNQQTFAYGLRNPVGLDFHPETKELYTTVNERDGLGDDLVPDYFTRIRSGEFYGWPYSYFTPNNLDPRHVQNGQSVRRDLVKKTLKPDVLFQAHSAALGLQFYDGNTFPEPYKKGAFVAFRGSWNRNSGTGYKLVFIPFNQGRPQGYYEEFLTGFLVNPAIPETWGRPVGLLVLPDGSLIFTEESNGWIYRVQYSP
ncbi:PQQ-dependent sugar dehydrogenase [Planktothrix agardhii]|jgi:glucose/arabinose dehydrogenase|uniref:L-sorbosone dehydrogenase n=2 Tax=Planktothrix agardhii TaxID=1160 RepID=A0AAD1Q333_PLAAG|nr:sorbosone dehydrogenase family protein [Planktothrix agardhii]MCF3606762.1 sorbosone dehydrogenase family protein [Planktothrix agardhii 1033]MCB8750984.1 sorbosone dehydrogenase family protein [Planktothrix agardhii 1810]MCB8759721.1 sorbosone dehydrogenase family protein [Planktothrix agardhii 1813]MCB8764518.1 sorbosone dehydrogenase family protein [Planktothrix agardhii 1809]MCB8766200.1 sorbosone dehydrogenase family protein [Planktothrix agardhii 1809]